MECVRCRLHAGLRLQFRADDVDIAIYLINKGPSSSLDGHILKEAWHVKGKLLIFKDFWLKPFPTLIKKIEQSLRQNQINVPLLDMELVTLVIAFMIMKNTKSLGEEMSYSMKRFCIRIRCRKKKTKNTQCLMRKSEGSCKP